MSVLMNGTCDGNAFLHKELDTIEELFEKLNQHFSIAGKNEQAAVGGL